MNPRENEIGVLKLAAFVSMFALLPLFAGAAPAAEQTGTEIIREAKSLARSNRAEGAVDLLSQFISEDPALDGDEAMFQRGWILFSDLGRHEEAINDFVRIGNKYPESEYGDDGMYYAGYVAHYHLRDRDWAMELYQKGYDRYPLGDFRSAIADKMLELRSLEPVDLAGHLPAIALSTPVSPAPPAAKAAAGPRHPPETDVSETSPLRPDTASEVTMQFENAPLRTYIQWVAEVTGRNFIVDDNVTGNITVYSGRALPFSEIYRVFLSILDIKGFAAIQSGGVTKIVARQKATQTELPILIDDDVYLPTDRVVMRIFTPKTISASALQGLIRPFITGNDQAVVNAETNKLIVTGSVFNLARIAELIAIVDTAREPVILRSYRVQNGKASVVVEKMSPIVSNLVTIPGAPSPLFKLVADERTNTVHALGDDGFQARVLTMINELDIDKASERIVKLFNLNYARAEEVVVQLRSLLGLDAIDNSIDFGGVVQTVLISDPRLNVVSVSTFAPRVVELVDSYVRHIDRAPTEGTRQTKLVRLQNAQAKELHELLAKIFPPDAKGQDAFSMGMADRVVISPDQRTNSLIITATAADWVKLARLIADLDVRKAQVLIDAVVLETSLDEARAVGVSLTTTEPPTQGTTRILGGSILVPPDQALRGGLVVTAVRGSTPGSILQALLTSSRTNILQMPQLMALDNERATIAVGDLTPIISSRSVSPDNAQIAGSSSIYQNVDYKNIGLNLAIKPHIGKKGDILLELMLEVQNRSTTSEVGLPVFSNRTIESKIQVEDSEYVILGGLLRTQETSGRRETPWLSKIPILGALFRNTSTEEEKTVLLIFLRPRVVTDPATLRDVTEEERLQYEAESKNKLGTGRTEVEKWLPGR